MTDKNSGTTGNKTGHELLTDEKAAMIILDLDNSSTIQLEGSEIVRGTHEEYGPITVVTPAAGLSCLLYPFDTQKAS